MDLEFKRHFVTSRMAFDYHMRPDQSSAYDEIVLLLHGYTETGKKIFEKLRSVISPNAFILAPNGVFPMPYRAGQGYKVGYSWYFYDPGLKEYFIDMSVAIDFLYQGIQALHLQSVPIRIIGFSQGGYLAPFIAHRLGNVKQVVGIGCEYLVDEFPANIQFRIDGIHGDLDDVVSPADAKGSHSNLEKSGILGEFRLISGLGHRIDSSVQSQLKELLLKK